MLDKKKSVSKLKKPNSVSKINANNKGKVSKILHPIFASPRTLGQRTADSLTKWAGSWVFIIGFLIFLGLWIYVNVHFLLKVGAGEAWDPYPFILLNLVLSCLAAIQAPVILMSQNRQSQKDRQRAEYDYAVNRKSEREIQQIKKIVERIDRKTK